MFAQDHGKVVLPLDLWKLDTFFIQPQNLISGPESINGVLKKTLRRRPVEVLAIKEIVVDLLFRKVFGAAFGIDRQMGKAAQVIV
ncbi:hypothetical protein MWU76_21265 [Gelidibacter sp. F2691]|nr:hypothetical protein [Gelidibacter sp. F2691]